MSTSVETVANLQTKEVSELPPELKKGLMREYFESALVTVIMALFGMTFVVQAVKVPTGSMLNTILVGDQLLVNKFIFGKDGFGFEKFLPHRQIQRGDIIVFKYPENPSINYVKRVIGLPGESVEVRDTKILINGQELPEHIVNAEPHVTNSAKDFNKTDDKAPLDISPEQDAAPQNSLKYKAYYSKELRAEEFYLDDRKPAGQKYGVGEPFKIPDGHYFVMGDNRDNSQDSRYWGTVPRENVVGKAFVVYWSLDQSRDSEGNETSGNFLVDIFTRTRWSRMGTLIK